jgi:uncharacterized protein (DUF885 family)
MSGAEDHIGPAERAVALDALAEAYWQATVEFGPVLATLVGDHRFDDRMPDPTSAAAAAHAERLASLLAGVESLGPAASLPETARVTWSALCESVHGEVEALASGLRDWNVDPMEGVPAGLLTIGDVQPADTPAAAEVLIARWRAIAGYVDAHTATLRASLGDGRVAATPTIQRTIALLDGLLTEPPERWPLAATPVTALLAKGDADGAAGSPQRERLAAAIVAVTGDEIRPAFARLRGFLIDELLPAARPATAPGMGHVPGGQDGYRRLIRSHTSLDVTPEALHATGLQEIERIDAELEELAGRVLGTRTLAEAIDRLRGDPALGFATREEVLQSGVAALARANAAIPAFFGRLPVAPCVVVPMRPHEEEHGTIAYYREPAPDGSRPGQFYLNLAHPETRRRYEAEALAYHEAVPGHHLQLAIMQELSDMPAFRRHLGVTAFVEGWGLYTERLADEMGLYTDDLSRLGVLSFDAWRASRLVVDTGMHALGWTRDAAVAFMTEHTALATNNIANEVDRYIGMPAQALAYKTGQLEMLRLRTAAQARLGARFDIRGFHDVLLGSGAVPLTTMADLVEGWVGTQLAG